EERRGKDDDRTRQPGCRLAARQADDGADRTRARAIQRELASDDLRSSGVQRGVEPRMAGSPRRLRQRVERGDALDQNSEYPPEPPSGRETDPQSREGARTGADR